MPEIRSAIAWKRNDEGLTAAAAAFWQSMGMTPEAIGSREGQLCNVALADGRVVGLTTVSLDHAAKVKCRVGFLCCAVAPEFRKHYLATFLTRDSLTILEHWSLDNPQEDVKGLAFVVQADQLGGKAVYPMWADWNTHYNLIGYTPRDEQIRLAWFRHAQLN